jgi:PTH1 family peptidyl-tRNA hydrolase
MRLIVGLGNPGKNYQKTRHNMGFMVLDAFFSKIDKQFRKQKNYDFIEYKGVISIKPKTFMNLSGKAVTAVQTKTRIDDILVIVDDIYLPIGEIRLRESGGLAGHNGLKSIAEALGTREFKRMRIGVGSPNSKELSDYVLSEFSSNDLKILDHTLSFASELLETYISDDFDEMVKYYSKKKKSYSELIMQAQDLSIEN